MQIAIVGLAGSGKTTVFNTLTRGHAETGGYGGVTLNVGVVKVPDERLDRLAEIFKPKKIVQADVTYVDLPAPPASTEGHVGTEELPADHLARLRDRDALLHVVRAFEDPADPASGGQRRPGPRPRAARPRVHCWPTWRWPSGGSSGSRRSGRHGTPGRARGGRARGGRPRAASTPGCEAGTPIRDLGLDADDEKAIRGFRFLTEKPVLVLLNVGEGDLRRGAGARRRASRPATTTSTRWSRRCRPGSRWSSASSSPTRRRCSWRSSGIAESGPRPGDRAVLPAARADLVPDRRAGRGPGLADPRRVDGGRRRRGDPHRPRQGLHPRRDRRATRTC